PAPAGACFSPRLVLLVRVFDPLMRFPTEGRLAWRLWIVRSYSSPPAGIRKNESHHNQVSCYAKGPEGARAPWVRCREEGTRWNTPEQKNGPDESARAVGKRRLRELLLA